MAPIARFSALLIVASIAQMAMAAPKPTKSVAPAAPAKGSFSGDATFSDAGLGSCGTVSKDSELVVAVNAPQMANGANPSKNVNCGRNIHIVGPKGSVIVKTTDTCEDCKKGDLVLTEAGFKKIADLDDGRVKITWNWV
ncbi:RlpA-like double-psi beta-barrel-protein domain-containing protein-containing protein [Spinellus fusiger]|nr:RlpA-like double-psi beta-barrel-protein domain-containing protein-containing protein [Spinellus fusiger]